MLDAGSKLAEPRRGPRESVKNRGSESTVRKKTLELWLVQTDRHTAKDDDNDNDGGSKRSRSKKGEEVERTRPHRLPSAQCSTSTGALRRARAEKEGEPCSIDCPPHGHHPHLDLFLDARDAHHHHTTTITTDGPPSPLSAAGALC